MPQLVKKRRSGWAVLATGALVASLLAVGASPAGAQDYSARADNKALTSACVGDALGDQMFTDVSDMHTFKDAINCIAYYGVTNGTGDGSTYSPNQDVIRAEMAVFIARAAGAAGVDLGDAMDAGFTDIGDVWAEAQDAINRLASKGMIASGGAYRPGDAVTRAEMASFLIGLLVKASPDVSTSSAGALQLAGATPGSVTMSSAWNWFGDARATVPAANDAEISALYELGVTDGASAAAVQDPTKAPLDVNYEPGGTVNRGEMAAFITRALAHTSVRPAGVSAQYDGSDVVLSVRDDMFQPMSNVLVDAFLTDTGAVDLAFRANDTCGEVSKLGGGQHLCEVDGADPLTGGDGDASVAHTVPRGGTTVWAWTGDTGDTVGSGTDPYRVVIPYEAGLRLASQAKFTTDNVGKAHMGTSVVYTLQLEDGDGAVTSGSDGRNAAKYSGVQRTYAYDTATSAFSTTALSVMPVSLTTDSDGKATVTFSAPADPDRTTKGDKFRVTLTLAAGDNAPTGFVDAMGGTLDLTAEATIAVVFSTQAGVTAFTAHSGATPATSSDITVSVKAASGYLGAAARGASNRATVTVTDQYGDPITGVKVTLTSSDGTTTDGATPPVITPGKSTLMATTSGPAPRELAVGRDGSFSFGYVFTSSVADTETLTGSLVGYDHDGDGCSAAQIDESGHRCQDVDPNTIGDQPGTAPITVVGATPAVVQWATAATANDTTGQIVRAVDTDTNTIFVSGTVATDDPVADSVRVLYYDSNDRFNITGQGASTYAGFERALKVGATLAWEFDTSAVTGTRKVNEYTLTPAS